ncbi:hypothetical protein V6255_10935 [Psychromonas arctica]|uniref:Uncharacterized protein n=1 Tax=Psychromonas arctica TaxID=168275 RepID=A0ABU9HCZ2_9GAMM
MSDKEVNVPLTVEQKQEIVDILERIRAGLNIPLDSQFEEPAHIFNPGVFNAKK